MQFTFALEACIIHLEEEPWKVLFEKVPDYVDGLNTAEINRLAVAVGLPQIFECTDDVDDAGHDSRWVTVNDPAGRHPVVWKTWCRSFGRDEPNPRKRDRTIKYLKAWMEKYNELAADEKSPAGGAATEVKSDSPVPLLKPKAASRCVKLFGRGDTPWVNGKDKKPLTKAQYDAVFALIEAGDKGLTKDRLDRKSHHTDARKILKRLAESDPDWKSVIVFPETPGKGYRIR